MSKKITPQERVEKHEAAVRESLEKYGLVQLLTVHFPRQTVPTLGRLGVWLVNRSGGRIVTKYRVLDDTITSSSRHKK